MPNGVDFEWDEFSGNTGNCWYGNVNAQGVSGTGTGPYPGAPPNVLPSDCDSSVGPGDAMKTAILIDCSNGPDEDTGPLTCHGGRSRRGRAAPLRAARRQRRSEPRAASTRASARGSSSGGCAS